MKKYKLAFIVIVILLIIIFQIIFAISAANQFIKNEMINQFEYGYKDYLNILDNTEDFYFDDIVSDEILETFYLESNLNARYELLEDSIMEYDNAKFYVSEQSIKPGKIDLTLNITEKHILPTPFNIVFIILSYEEIVEIDKNEFQSGRNKTKAGNPMIAITLINKWGNWTPVYMERMGYIYRKNE